MLRKILLAAAAVPIAALGVQWGATANAAVRPKPLLVCTATVSNPHPVDYSTVPVKVWVGAPGIKAAVTAHYKTTNTTKTAVSVRTTPNYGGGQPLAQVQFSISNAKPGYKVKVTAVVSRPGWRPGSCSTWFIPQHR